MEFSPENQKQEEAFEFASQLCNLLNEGVEKGFLDRTKTHNYAMNGSNLINLHFIKPKDADPIYVKTNEISKL